MGWGGVGRGSLKNYIRFSKGHPSESSSAFFFFLSLNPLSKCHSELGKDNRESRCEWSPLGGCEWAFLRVIIPVYLLPSWWEIHQSGIIWTSTASLASRDTPGEKLIRFYRKSPCVKWQKKKGIYLFFFPFFFYSLSAKAVWALRCNYRGRRTPWCHRYV